MSKDKIEVSMSVYDIPIVIEELEKAEDEIKKLNNNIKKVNKYIIKKFTNQDGTIWHEDMRDIYNILNNKGE